jgi:hypothetical protein
MRFIAQRLGCMVVLLTLAAFACAAVWIAYPGHAVWYALSGVFGMFAAVCLVAWLMFRAITLLTLHTMKRVGGMDSGRTWLSPGICYECKRETWVAFCASHRQQVCRPCMAQHKMNDVGSAGYTGCHFTTEREIEASGLGPHAQHS